MKIVFMGTPDFAVPSLKILVENGYDVVGVVTAPDKPAGRGQHLSQSAVKKCALAYNLQVLQPEKLKAPDFIAQLQALNADLQVVVAFRMLPAAVFTMPPLGCINLHASLLPAYRGAAPINWAIINGENETGLTTFYIEQQIDAGRIIKQLTLPICETETAGQLHDKMMLEGAQLLLETVQKIGAHDANGMAQPARTDNLPAAPKLNNENCRIDWQQPALTIYNLIRGLSPYPAAFTMLNGQWLKIYSASIKHENHSLASGTIVLADKKSWQIAVPDGFIVPILVQLEGKKAMSAADFLNGYRQGLFVVGA